MHKDAEAYRSQKNAMAKDKAVAKAKAKALAEYRDVERQRQRLLQQQQKLQAWTIRMQSMTVRQRANEAQRIARAKQKANEEAVKKQQWKVMTVRLKLQKKQALKKFDAYQKDERAKFKKELQEEFNKAMASDNVHYTEGTSDAFNIAVAQMGRNSDLHVGKSPKG